MNFYFGLHIYVCSLVYTNKYINKHIWLYGHTYMFLKVFMDNYWHNFGIVVIWVLDSWAIERIRKALKKTTTSNRIILEPWTCYFVLIWFFIEIQNKMREIQVYHEPPYTCSAIFNSIKKFSNGIFSFCLIAIRFMVLKNSECWSLATSILN